MGQPFDATATLTAVVVALGTGSSEAISTLAVTGLRHSRGRPALDIAASADWSPRRHKLSERRACRLVEQHRSTQRYQRLKPEYELRLVARMNELAAAHPRWGYRRVWALLRSEGWRVNRKRIERLWRLEGHRVPPRRSQASGKKAQGTAANAVWNRPAAAPNQIWSYDFMSARTRDGASLRILNVVDGLVARRR
jgi:hypothetical protein